MDKQQLIEIAAQVSGLSIEQIETALNSVLETIIEAIAEGKQVEIKKFGTFSFYEHTPRSGIVAEGPTVPTSRSVIPGFSGSKFFRKRVTQNFRRRKGEASVREIIERGYL